MADATNRTPALAAWVAALEMLGFAGPEVREGLASHLEKHPPVFDPDSPV